MTEDKDIPSPQQPLAATHPHLTEFASFLPELNKETERGVVLIATSFIDELMRRTLLAFLIESDTSSSLIEGFSAPLGSLATRSAAAFALGLISKSEMREADTLRKIRNQFAHHVHVSFESRSIGDLGKNLTMAAEDYGCVPVDARGRFTTAAVAFILHLTSRPHYVSQQRRQFVEWLY